MPQDSGHEYLVEISGGEGPPTSRVYRSSVPITEGQVLADLDDVEVTKILEPARPGQPGRVTARRSAASEPAGPPARSGIRANPWAFLTVLIVVAGVVAALGIYWGFRDTGMDNESARARAAAGQIAFLCKNRCTVQRVDRIAHGLWRTREVDRRGTVYCATIDLRYFKVGSAGKTLDGVGLEACPK